MHRYLVFLGALALPVLCFGLDEFSQLRVKDLGGDTYRLTLTSTSISNLAEAQAALLPEARKLCGEKTPQLGHYQYDSTEGVDKAGKPVLTVGKLVLVQNIRCQAAVAAAPAAPDAAPDPDWKPSDEDYKAVYAAIARFFAAKDKGDTIATYAMLDTAAQQNITFKQWVTQSDDFAAQAGAPVSHWVVKYSWYKNPRNTPEPGVYATADFVDHYKNVDADCGYVSLHQQDDGSFRVLNQQHGLIPLNAAQTQTPAQLTALKIKLNCASDGSGADAGAKGTP